MRKILLALMLVVGLVGQAFATAPTIPSVGVDLDGWIAVLVIAIGQLVVLVVGAVIAFCVIKVGLGWVRRYVGADQPYVDESRMSEQEWDDYDREHGIGKYA